MKRNPNIVIVLAIATALLSFPTSYASAQNSLYLTRLVQKWPTIELYVTAICQGQEVLNLKASDFHVTENDEPMSILSLSCPDTNSRCNSTVALIFDCSSKMTGGPISGQRSAGQVFINEMDGTNDAACLIKNTTVPIVGSTITTSKSKLTSAIKSTYTNGYSALWDACKLGLQLIIPSTSNPCRAMIVMAGSPDQASSSFFTEIYYLALNNNIVIYTIGFESMTNSDELKTLAEQTGGKFYPAYTVSDMWTSIADIVKLIHRGFQECKLTYQTYCEDGIPRQVNLWIDDFCYGPDSASISYTPPYDAGSFLPVNVQVDTASTVAGETATVPIRILQLPYDRIPTGSCVIQMDTTMGRIIAVETAGTLLEGVPVNITHNGMETTLRFTQSKTISSTGVLCNLRVKTIALFGYNSLPLHLTNWTWDYGCFNTHLHHGLLRLSGGTVPGIKASGPSRFCYGRYVTLSAADGFIEYEWSTGEKSRSIIVTRSGSYTVKVRDITGMSATSAPFEVVVDPLPSPTISPGGNIRLCPGKKVTLDAGTGWVSCRWNTGDTGPTITVDSDGVYWAYVLDGNGCWGLTDTVCISIGPLNPIIIPNGSTAICPGGSVDLDAGEGYAVYRWNTGEQTRVITARTAGMYQCTVADAYGCIGVTPALFVTEGHAVKPTISIVGSNPLCIGDTLVLEAGAGYDSYSWSTGATGMQIHVIQAGRYWLSVMDKSGCHAQSDTLIVATVSKPVKPIIAASGPTAFCDGGSVSLDAGGAYAAYKWNSGATTRVIVASGAGSYSCMVGNENGCREYSDTVVVRVYPLPAKPGITREPNSNTLNCITTATGYQWLLNGTPIQGATQQSYKATDLGNYRVVVYDSNACTAMSDSFVVDVLVSTDRVTSRGIISFDIHPEPNTGRSVVQLEIARPCMVTITVYDVLGRTMITSSEYSFQTSYLKQLDCTSLPSGSYFVRALLPDGNVVKRMTVRR